MREINNQTQTKRFVAFLDIFCDIYRLFFTTKIIMQVFFLSYTLHMKISFPTPFKVIQS